MRRGSREPGTECRLYVDGLTKLEPGHFITTSEKTGYLVMAMRPSPTYPARRYLTCVRWPPAEIPEGSTVWAMTWYSRDKRKARR